MTLNILIGNRVILYNWLSKILTVFFVSLIRGRRIVFHTLKLFKSLLSFFSRTLSISIKRILPIKKIAVLYPGSATIPLPKAAAFVHGVG